jgi:hypothetical protein
MSNRTHVNKGRRANAPAFVHCDGFACAPPKSGLKGSPAVADFGARLLRSLFMLALGLLVLGLAAFLFLFTLSLVLGNVLWGLLTGRRTHARDQWGRFQKSAASAVWRRYRQSTGGPGRAAGRADTAEVVDVDFRDGSAPSPGPDRLGR